MTTLLALVVMILRMPFCVGVALHPFLSDNMVLARAPESARLWGWGTPGERIVVTIDGTNATGVVVEDDGRWQLSLPEHEASAGPHTILVTGSQSPETLSISNVAFGDVYLCSGQSNMEFAVSGAFDAKVEIADSARYPLLRFATLNKTVSDTPQERATPKSNYAWAVSGPDAFGDLAFSWPSAVCYFFGRDLHKQLGRLYGSAVPIGLVTAAWGGQRVEAFSSPDAMADDTCGGTQSHDESTRTSFSNRRLPETSELWNSMIHPFLNMRFAGAVWYQGESNVADPMGYACRFPAMIADWRRKMDLRLPFYFVQLAGYHDDDFAELRDAQMAARELEDVGYASAIDLGDPHSPFGAIHPRSKQEVGRRLVQSVLKGSYGLPLVTTGPVVREVVTDKSFPHSLLVEYQPGTTEQLHLSGTASCKVCCEASPFEVRSRTGNWTRANATVVGDRAMLAVPEGVDKPEFVRYDWEGYPQCAIYNGHDGATGHMDLPGTPFCVQTRQQSSWFVSLWLLPPLLLLLLLLRIVSGRLLGRMILSSGSPRLGSRDGVISSQTELKSLNALEERTHGFSES